MTAVAQPKRALGEPPSARAPRTTPAWVAGLAARRRVLGARVGAFAGTVARRLAPAVVWTRAIARRLSVVTGVGWLALAGGLVVLLAGAVFGWVEAVAVGLVGVVAAVLAIIWTIGGANYAAALEVDSTRVRVGDHVLGRVTITNRGRRSLTGSLIELPVGRSVAALAVPAMGSGAQHEQIFGIPTKRRAVITLGPVRSVKSDPLGLIRRIREWSDSIEVYVHPRTVLVDADTSGLLRDVEGVVTQDLSSSDVAFHALRDYVPGDDRRSVHWRSTARLGRLIVRQFEETRKTHLLVILSLNSQEYATDEEFETAVSSAASLVLQAIRLGRDVSLFTQNGPLKRTSPVLLLDEMCRLETRTGCGRSGRTDSAGSHPGARCHRRRAGQRRGRDADPVAARQQPRAGRDPVLRPALRRGEPRGTAAHRLDAGARHSAARRPAAGGPGAAMKTTTAALANLGVVALAAALGTLTFGPVFGGGAGYWAAGGGAVLGLVIAWVSSWRGWGVVGTAGAVLAAFLLFVGVFALPETTLLGFVPTLETLGRGTLLIVQSWRDLLTVAVPASSFSGPAVVPFLTGLVCVDTGRPDRPVGQAAPARHRPDDRIPAGRHPVGDEPSPIWAVDRPSVRGRRVGLGRGTSGDRPGSRTRRSRDRTASPANSGPNWRAPAWCSRWPAA